MRKRMRATPSSKNGWCAACDSRILYPKHDFRQIYCTPCNEWLKLARGLINRVLGRFDGHDKKCEDCGARARCRDHRDYGKPIDVAYVCYRCNSLRGPAKFPRSVVRASRTWYAENRNAAIIKELEKVPPEYVAYRFRIKKQEVLSIMESAQ